MRHLLLALSVPIAISGIVPGSTSAAAANAPSTIAMSHAPVSAAAGQRREVFGFALAGTLSDATVGYPSWNFNLISTVAYFGLHVNDDGTFTNDSNWAIWNSTQRNNLVAAAHAKNTKVVVTIVLQDFSAGTPHMCAGLAHMDATVGYIASQVRAQAVDGANIDYEGLNGGCGTADSSSARHSFTTFITKLRAALPVGSYLSVDTYASSASDPVGFFDVPGLSPHVDSFFVMAYDLEYSNYRRSPTSCSKFCLGPTSPLTGYYYNNANTASQYLGKVPASKVILGVPYYGRKACVASGGANQYPTSSVVADSYLDAIGEATAAGVKPGSYLTHRDAHDPAGQERWDTWFNTTMNCTRQLYWDDVVSLGHKYDLVNQDNLRGVGIWTLNYGGGQPELWSSLALHFGRIPGTPGNLSACAGNASASISWTPATSTDGPITSYVVTASPGGASVTVPGSATYATLGGLTAGTPYNLSVEAINNSGTGVAAKSVSITPSSTTVYRGYFSWFDTATAGMLANNIHLVNPGAAASSGCVTLSGRIVQPFTLAAGQETHLTFPKGTIGGPVVVTVSSGPAVLASQRVQYYQSFNEIWALTPDHATTMAYINWFDRVSPGMVADNIHVLNPGTASANVTVSLAGATPIVFVLAGGSAAHVTFPAGHIGGPVKVTATQPVLATQRVQYYRSFNEVAARAASEASTVSYFNWFDRRSIGMVADNIHVLNPGATVANVTVTMPGASPIAFNLPAGAGTHVAFPAGRIGGPVKVTSSQPVIATQRVQYYQSFNEVGASTTAHAALIGRLMWFDRATPGMAADNIHVFNTGTATASITISMPGATSIVVTAAAGGEIHVTFPAGKIGGPVSISSTQPVLAAQRVQYYQSFNEVSAG